MPIGRYAPSPTGDLHVGNLRTGMLAWLFARHITRPVSAVADGIHALCKPDSVVYDIKYVLPAEHSDDRL